MHNPERETAPGGGVEKRSMQNWKSNGSGIAPLVTITGKHDSIIKCADEEDWAWVAGGGGAG